MLMHDFSISRALFSDSISVRFSAWQVKDAPGTTSCVWLCSGQPARSALPCDEGEHGLQHTSPTPRRASLTPIPTSVPMHLKRWPWPSRATTARARNAPGIGLQSAMVASYNIIMGGGESINILLRRQLYVLRHQDGG